jgi:hypothetical protein
LVAIKLCRHDSPKAHARFAREVELLQKYANPGVVKLKDHGLHDTQPLRMAESLWNLIDEVLERACALRPERRYQDAAALLAALPKVVLGPVALNPAQTSIPMVNTETAPEVALDSNEIAVLAAVIGKCPVPGQSVKQVTLERSMPLSSYNYSMAMRRLLRVGFLELVSWSDDEGNSWDQVGLTSRGEEWAFSHPKEMTPPEPAAGDDEIPF